MKTFWTDKQKEQGIIEMGDLVVYFGVKHHSHGKWKAHAWVKRVGEDALLWVKKCPYEWGHDTKARALVDRTELKRQALAVAKKIAQEPGAYAPQEEAR